MKPRRKIGATRLNLYLSAEIKAIAQRRAAESSESVSDFISRLVRQAQSEGNSLDSAAPLLHDKARKK